MKKAIGLILVFCLLFTFAADAFAAGKPNIKKQPVDGKVKNGKVSFQVKVSGSVDSYTWYLINPETNEAVSAKQLKKNKTIPKLVISGENRAKLSLSKVPESMHGWTVYCHIAGNGYKVDSDSVLILYPGKDVPDKESPSGSDDSSAEPEDKAKADSSDASDDSGSESAGQQPIDSDTASPENDAGEPADENEDTPAASSVVAVSSSARVLYPLDQPDAKPASKLEFTGSGSFMVKSEEPISSWSVNGVRFELAEPVFEFKVTNVTSSLNLDFSIQRKAASAIVVDESKPCTVTCEGCTFTCIPRKLYSVTEGQVPAGSQITVIAGNPASAKNGYVINGADPDYQDLSSFSLIVDEDMKIVLK